MCYQSGSFCQNAETSRFAAERIYSQGGQGADRRTNLKSSSQKTRGWGIYGIRNKAAGRSEASGGVGSVGKGDWETVWLSPFSAGVTKLQASTVSRMEMPSRS